ncbi:reductase (plasmid) [Burkholderia sp. THE68]|uniref:NAD(P)/FAD-dependent oxidoreductase n=1 Tax=Burkholderia sp. THE68 TaxID=758782 RepID=UPI0013199629|nr:FAD-dependent oxidoreductase [Burkholderia sp. THE68]BBU31976.1 reductase [Burkholderia sp. THE68]
MTNHSTNPLHPRVVIVGAGQAAAAVARTLRAEGHHGDITMLGAERVGPYERPPLSKTWLSAEGVPALASLLNPSQPGQLEVDLRTGVNVTRIDRASRTVHAGDGTEFHFDRLVIATGGRARRLAVPGDASDEIAYLRTIDDASHIRRRLDRGKRLLVIGGGWIGLETACSARKVGVEVVLVEVAQRLCERTVPAIVGEHLLDIQRSLGVDVRLGASIEQLSKLPDGRYAASLAGVREKFDLVVAGVGMVANDELAAASGLPCAGGVLCDVEGRTVDPHVFACGDVASFEHPFGPAGMRRLESWDNAEQQGAACARAILGKQTTAHSLPWFWSDQGDVNVQILGFPNATATPVVREGSGKTTLVWLEECATEEPARIVAAVCINAPADMPILRRMWQTGVSVDRPALAAKHVSLKSLLLRNAGGAKNGGANT